jgi:thiol:disulfide interchange protein DsbC
MLHHSHLLVIAGLASLVGAGGVYAAADAADAADVSLARALGARLPRTHLTAVDCRKISGLCEVQAGTTLFYTDHTGRYLIIGRVYDMDSRQDLTAARLLDISPETLVASAANSLRTPPNETADPGTLRGSSDGLPGMVPEKVSLAGLPSSGAIEWGAGPRTVTVFSDFRCGYCNRLHTELQGMDVRVVERPISVLGTRAISNAVICSTDKKSALVRAYRGDALPAVGVCDTTGLDANEAFARDHGFAGTPVIVRSDGAVIHGFRPRVFLDAWLKEVR